MPNARRSATKVTLAILLLTVLAAGGCASYKLRGTVIEAKESRILVVNADDPRLNQRGLGGVSIKVTQDPESLGRKKVGEGESDGQGRFAISISSFGAGFLEYPMAILARRQGHTPAIVHMQLPGSGRRLLIELAPGQDSATGVGDGSDLLNNTLKESQPYLNEK